LYSSRSAEDTIYAEELQQLVASQPGLGVYRTLTRAQPHGWTGYARRIYIDMLREVAAPLGNALRSYVCGSTSLVESVADNLTNLGIPADRIRTERFGPTGGTL
jgi:ferredoxin-NADP reductase